MKDKFPLISIIIPTYKCANVVSGTIESVAASTYPNIEIIIVLQVRGDDTEKVVKKYGANNECIRIIYNEKIGAMSARIKGMEEAVGEFVFFVDADDEIAPNMIEKLYENARSFGADISCCGYEETDIYGGIKQFYGSGKIRVWDKEKGLKYLISSEEGRVPLWNKMYSRRVIDEFLERRPEVETVYLEDLLMNWTFFGFAERIVHQDVCLYHHIIRDTSVSVIGDRDKVYRDFIKVYRYIYKNASPELKVECKYELIRQCVYICNLVIRETDIPYDNALFTKIISALKKNKHEVVKVRGKLKISGIGLTLMTRWYVILYKKIRKC